MKNFLCLLVVLMLSLAAYAQHKTQRTKQPAALQTKAAAPVVPAVAPPVPPPSPGVFRTTDSLEKMPEFTGGYASLRRYLGTNLEYPRAAMVKGIQGKVIVSFTVCEDGSLCDERVIQALGGGCEQEALRVIKKMPRWNPGMKDGKPVKVQYILPVMFQLID